MDLIIFDLDNTLIKTDYPELDPIRRSLRNENNLPILRDFLGKCGNLTRIPEKTLKNLNKKCSLAVFSGAPRCYVNYMLSHYYPNIEFSAVICYEDVGRMYKPSPCGIIKAMKNCGTTSPEKVIYIGDDYRDRIAAASAGCRYMHWNWYKTENEINCKLNTLEQLYPK